MKIWLIVYTCKRFIPVASIQRQVVSYYTSTRIKSFLVQFKSWPINNVYTVYIRRLYALRP